MTAPETPSPSPLTLDPPMTVAEVDRLSFLAQADADRWTAYRASIGDDFSKVNVREALEAGLVGASAMSLLSFLPHVRTLAARVSDLEARLESAHRGLGEWRAKHEALETDRDTMAARIRQLQDEALDVAECRRLANVAVDQAEAARAKLRSVMAERDGLRALCDRVREARKTAPLLHTFHCARGPTEECACGIGELRAAIEALGPGGKTK